jgi:hypothetical protein
VEAEHKYQKRKNSSHDTLKLLQKLMNRKQKDDELADGAAYGGLGQWPPYK